MAEIEVMLTGKENLSFYSDGSLRVSSWMDNDSTEVIIKPEFIEAMKEFIKAEDEKINRFRL